MTRAAARDVNNVESQLLQFRKKNPKKRKCPFFRIAASVASFALFNVCQFARFSRSLKLRLVTDAQICKKTPETNLVLVAETPSLKSFTKWKKKKIKHREIFARLGRLIDLICPCTSLQAMRSKTPPRPPTEHVLISLLNNFASSNEKR